jgi:putative ABC transport system permease protein
LIVSIGLGTAFICTLFSVQSILLNRVMLSASGNQSNTILFDIQPLQKDSVIALARQQGLPIDGTVPIVNMRLEKVNNITLETLQKDSTIKMHEWVFDREYRVTFRDSITNSETITKGKWSGEVDKSSGTVFISIEERFARTTALRLAIQ